MSDTKVKFESRRDYCDHLSKYWINEKNDL